MISKWNLFFLNFMDNMFNLWICIYSASKYVTFLVKNIIIAFCLGTNNLWPIFQVFLWSLFLIMLALKDWLKYITQGLKVRIHHQLRHMLDLIFVICRNPNLGFTTKVRACKGASQKWAQESHFMLLGVQESVKEWTPTLPNELPLWELESQWTPEFLEGDCRGQNSLDWKGPYIIGKILELRCLKCARMTHLGS
jgi:hypothetical protein